MENYTVNDNDSPLSVLSEKEAVCVVNYFKRKSCKETAQELGISHRTVEKYLERIRKNPDFNLDEAFRYVFGERVREVRLRK